MRKINIILVALLSVVLTSCNQENVDICPGENVLVGNVCFDVTKPEFRGIEDTTIYLNENFDPLEGITAFDDMDGDITENIIFETSISLHEVGSYIVTYFVEDSNGNETIAIRYVTVEIDYSIYTENLVQNGTFDANMAGWTILNNYLDGAANFRVLNQELMVEILTIPEEVYYWTPRLEYQNLTILQDKEYYVSFDARADAPRYLHIQFGELLPYEPWFTDFRPGADKIYFITEEMQTFSFTFTMNLETNTNGALIFEMGHVGESNLITNFYFDNIVVKQVGE